MESDVSEQKSDFCITGQDNRYKHGRNWHGKSEFLYYLRTEDCHSEFYATQSMSLFD
jgi:hypothetical protein